MENYQYVKKDKTKFIVWIVIEYLLMILGLVLAFVVIPNLTISIADPWTQRSSYTTTLDGTSIELIVQVINSFLFFIVPPLIISLNYYQKLKQRGATVKEKTVCLVIGLLPIICINAVMFKMISWMMF